MGNVREMLCQISGVFRTPNGELIPEGTVVRFKRSAQVHGVVVGTGPTVVIPDEVSLTIGAGGLGSIGVYPGRYQVIIGVGHTFQVNVPQEASISFVALITQAPEYSFAGSIDPFMNYAAEAYASMVAAGLSENAADVSEAAALGSQNAAQAARLGSEAARDASVVAKDVSEVAAAASISAATVATTKADQASESQTAAAVSATSAAGSASTATTQAGVATTKAGEASASATAAATSEASVAGLVADLKTEVAGNLVPVGSVLYFAGPVAPTGWLVCDGTAVSEVFADLRTYLINAGNPYGVVGADPRLPDLRGEFIRGADGGRGIDAGRVLGSAQLDAFQGHQHRLTDTAGTSVEILGGGTGSGSSSRPVGTSATGTNAVREAVTDGVNGTPRIAAETRPRNVALLACIKAFGMVNITGAANLADLLTAVATNAEAIAGLNNTKLMTPLRTMDTIVAYVAPISVATVVTGSSVAVVDIALPAPTSEFLLRVTDLIPVLANATLFIRFSRDGGVTYDSGASDYRNGAANGTAIQLSGGIHSDPGGYADLDVTLNGMKSGARRKGARSVWGGLDASSNSTSGTFSGYRLGNSDPITHIRLLMANGATLTNIARGRFALYAIR